MRPRTRGAVLAVAALAAAASASAAAALPQIGVRTTRASEMEPAAAPGYFAWVQDSLARPNRFNLFVRRAGGTTFRVNPSDTQGFVFGGAIDGDRLVWSRVRGGARDLRLFDLDERKGLPLPAGINTSLAENGASLSGDWLLYRRTNFATSTERILLHNLVTHEQRLLAMTSGGRYAQPGNVAGNYATWYACSRWTRCTARLYDITARTVTLVPNPNTRAQFAVSVTSAGTVYLAESGNIFCGADRRILRYPLGGPRSVLLAFGRDQDPALTSPRVNPDGSTDIFYDRFNCRTGKGDIYKIVEPGRSDVELAMAVDDPNPQKSDPVTVTLTVSNDGPTAAKAVVVSNTVPAGLSLVSKSAQCGEPSSFGVVRCSLGNVAVGDTPSVELVLQACQEGAHANVATVRSAWADPQPGDNSASVNVNVGNGPDCAP